MFFLPTTCHVIRDKLPGVGTVLRSGPGHAEGCTRRRVPNTALMPTKADLQRLRSLRDKKHREALGLFVVEGEKVVGELLAA